MPIPDNWHIKKCHRIDIMVFRKSNVGIDRVEIGFICIYGYKNLLVARIIQNVHQEILNLFKVFKIKFKIVQCYKKFN